MTKAVFWFSNDLRLDDNLALRKAIEAEPSLLFVYCIDPAWLDEGLNGCRSLGDHRYGFLLAALNDLYTQLLAQGQRLIVVRQSPLDYARSLYKREGVRRFYHSVNAGLYEQRLFANISAMADDIEVYSEHTHTLYEPSQLPFELHELPKTFSIFRRMIEQEALDIAPAVGRPMHFPEALMVSAQEKPQLLSQHDVAVKDDFFGGETTGLAHLTAYFEQPFAQNYRETRNALEGWSSSTKFSPWLALGCLSPRRVMQQLRAHESSQGSNDSTYWIFFELLWREYFQWYAHAHGERLFWLSGIRGQVPLMDDSQCKSEQFERFEQWCSGKTPYPLVNACLHQLNETGFMSNRGRQIVASCLIHELQLDWRYGAAYFEQQLIDYDVASNWGNWQYLAGVGADPRGSRRFNLEKQTQLYDPEGAFVQRWRG